MRPFLRAVTILLVCILPRAVFAAPQPADDPSESVEAPATSHPTEAERRQASRLTRQSLQLLKQEKWTQAEQVLEEALSLDPADPVNLYNLACVRARQNRRDMAMDSLERAAEAGFTDFVLLGRDPDLNSLRDLPRFKKLVANKDQWQRRAADNVVETLRERFGEEYLYSVDFDQKLIFATNVDEQTLVELKQLLATQARSQASELFEH